MKVISTGVTMAKRRKPTPDGWPTVTPRIFVDDVDGLVGFVKRVFKAKGRARGEGPAVLTIGDSRIMVSSAEVRARTGAFLYVYVDDADSTYRRAVAAGATSLEEPHDLPYGDRRGMVEDRWGNTWQIATHLG